ncbi:hypothetical protein K435DRAFT_610613, partial [Dendrothele bispora CBS 962.96]
LPWSGYIQGFPLKVDVHHLATFFGEGWLSGDLENLMMDLLRRDVAEASLESDVELAAESAWFIPKIIEASKKEQAYQDDQGFRSLRRIGLQLSVGGKRMLGTLANVNGNHWVAIVVDVEGRRILHGDSFGNKINPELGLALDWWIHQHFGEHFLFEDLPITAQRDGFSCGLLAWRALESFILGAEEQETENMADYRLEIFLRIVERHNNKV